MMRNPWLDMLRALAMFIVIFCHIMENDIDGGDMSRPVGVLCFISIPLFLVVSGYLTKQKHVDVNLFKNIISRLLVPYTALIVFVFVWWLYFSKAWQTESVSLLIADFGYRWVNGPWFIPAYILTYILWQVIPAHSMYVKLLAGTIVLVGLNFLALPVPELSQIMWLTLYSYTLFSASVCMRPYIRMYKAKHTGALLIASVCLMIPFATAENHFFFRSFSAMLQDGDWYIFFVRLFCGLAICTVLIHLTTLLKIDASRFSYIQKVGRYTLDIYLIQSFLVEILLREFLHLPDSITSYIIAFFVAIIMTVICTFVVDVYKRFTSF